MPGNNKFWSVFFLNGIGLFLATLICWLLSILACWLFGFAFAGWPVLIGVLTTVFTISFVQAAVTPAPTSPPGSSSDEPGNEDEEEVPPETETFVEEDKKNNDT